MLRAAQQQNLWHAFVGHGCEFLRWRGTLSYATGSHARARSGEDLRFA